MQKSRIGYWPAQEIQGRVTYEAANNQRIWAVYRDKIESYFDAIQHAQETELVERLAK